MSSFILLYYNNLKKQNIVLRKSDFDFLVVKEEGKEEKQQELIRQFSKINTPEQIAETLQVSVEYVLDILKDKPM